MGLSYLLESIAIFLPIAIWGGYFTIAFALLAICLTAYWQLRLPVAVQAVALCVVAILYTTTHLFYVQLSPDPIVSRVLSLATLGFVCTQFAIYLIVSGRMRNKQQRQKTRWTLGTLFALGCLAIAVLSQAMQWLAILLVVTALCTVAFLFGLSDGYNNKPYWRSNLFITITATASLLLFYSASYAQGHISPTLWLISGVASTAYMGGLMLLVTRRFRYLIDLRRATEAGANYDPITRTHLITEAVSKELDKTFGKREVLSSVLVLVLHNLEDILNTHQRIAYNHAQFVLASRLRAFAANTAFVGHGPQSNALPANSFFLVRRDGISTRDLYNFAGRSKQRLCLPFDLGFHNLVTDSGVEEGLWTPDISILAFECGLSELKDPKLIETLVHDSHKSAEMASGLGCYNNVGELMAINH